MKGGEVVWLFRSWREEVNQLLHLNILVMKKTKGLFGRTLVGGLLVCSLFMGSNALAVDPCSQTAQLSGGTTINNQNKTGNTSTGYQYEIWRDGNGGSLTLYPKDACFRAEWNNAGDFLGRVGKTFNKPAWNNIGGDLVANYAYKKSGNDGGTYSYIGIYGWMDNPP